MISWNTHQKMQGTKIKNFEFLKVLGSGSFAVVYEAVDSRDGSIVAIKVLPLKLVKSNPKVEELVQTQIRVLKQISKSKNANANVIRFIDNFMVSKSIFIVMEYCNGGDLSEYLDIKKRLTEDEATDFLKQILNGFRGLHEANAMHRDFKLANVLVHQGLCKIADLGFAKQLQKYQVAKTILGTDLTKAPEVLEEVSYGMEADIWSVGVVYYQMLYGVYPYKGFSDKDILKRIKQGPPNFKPVNISAQAMNFITRCLTVSPKQRITWTQIYDHPLIKNDRKAIYGLTSNFQINDNKSFYQNGAKVSSNFLNMQVLEVSGFDTIQKTEMIQSDQMSGRIKKNEEKKKQDLGLNRYQKSYLTHRNNIMFIFKFVTPYITNLLDLNANPDITLFILAKKAYHEMMQFSRQIEKKEDFLKLNPTFKQFVASPIYKQILHKIKRDCELIQDQVSTYRAGIANCNSNISQEFDLSQIKNPNWLQFVEQLIQRYEHQLGEQLDSIEGSVKEEVISVIYALKYYRDHLKNAETQECALKIAELDYEQAEKDIQKRLASQADDQ